MALRFVTSERFNFDREDVKSIVRGASIAGCGAFATYLVEGLVQLDFGELTPAVVAVLSILLNTVRKWLSESSYAVKK